MYGPPFRYGTLIVVCMLHLTVLVLAIAGRYVHIPYPSVYSPNLCVRHADVATVHCGQSFKHFIFQFPRDGQSEGWIVWHEFLGTALRAYVVYAFRAVISIQPYERTSYTLFVLKLQPY